MKTSLCSILLMGLAAVLAAPAWSQASTKADQDIAAWIEFMDQVKIAGTRFLQEHRHPDEISRAEGPLYLAQQLSHAVGAVLARRDEAFPLLRVSATNIDKWGLDGADAKYTGAPLDGGGTYRLSGRLGDATVIAIQLVQSMPEFKAFSSLPAGELMPDAEGWFSVMIAPERPPEWEGPWLPMDTRTTNLVVREYFNDWTVEQPSTMMLERLDEVSPNPDLTVTDASRILVEIAEAFDTRARMWMPWLEQTRSGPANRLSQLTPSGQGLTTNVYGEGWFQLEPDQALIIELDDPRADLWSFQLGNLWWESIDYINHTGSLNGHQAVPGKDGRYRLVIALEDPGVANWLDPAGHARGMIMYRFQNTDTAPVPKTRLVRLDQLAGALPADIPTVTPDQRRAQIEMRRAHAHRRWAP